MKARALVAWNVRRIRVERGISQEQLAYDASVDRSYVGGLERRSENPTVDLLDLGACFRSARVGTVAAASERSRSAKALAERQKDERLSNAFDHAAPGGLLPPC